MFLLYNCKMHPWKHLFLTEEDEFDLEETIDMVSVSSTKSEKMYENEELHIANVILTQNIDMMLENEEKVEYVNQISTDEKTQTRESNVSVVDEHETKETFAL